MTKEIKQQAVEILKKHLPLQAVDLEGIDARLLFYCAKLMAEPEMHNAYEILGAVKFLRLLRTYRFNHKKVRQVIRLREGEWRGDGNGICKHVSGGIACPGRYGMTYYRWEPFQVFVLASVFGFMAWVDTKETEETHPYLSSTEKVEEAYNEEGQLVNAVYDLRRLCTDFTFYAPRKTDKTGLSAFIQVVFFLLEDANSESYCCANSSDQAKLLYRRTKLMLGQLDDGHRFRMNETVCDWRNQFKSVRDSSIRPLSAGGKTKDGMNAQLCCADEYGSAPYTNGKSDMKNLVDVVKSSMGQRREPLVFTTTTAGRITTGPFIEKLDMLHKLLEREIDIENGDASVDFSLDRIMCILFEPDEWEKQDEEKLLTDRSIRAKINPMLGKIVQHQFYDDAVAAARLEGDTAEVVSKLFNVYQSATVTEWINAEQIRPLQKDMSIEDCKAKNGWLVFVGLDFSQGDDLHTAGYLAVRRSQYGGYEYFGDFDAWVKEEVLLKSSIRPLYEEWVRKGFLHVSPGKVFQPALFIQRLDQLLKAGVQFQFFGYDSYQSADPINTLKAYLNEKGVTEPDKYVVPVSQTNASFNPAVDQMTYCINAQVPMLHLSRNPMWPWLFQNCVLDSDVRYDNKKMRKRNPGSDSCKVDPVQCLAMGYILCSRYEGMTQKL